MFVKLELASELQHFLGDTSPDGVYSLQTATTENDYDYSR